HECQIDTQCNSREKCCFDPCQAKMMCTASIFNSPLPYMLNDRPHIQPPGPYRPDPIGVLPTVEPKPTGCDRVCTSGAGFKYCCDTGLYAVCPAQNPSHRCHGTFNKPVQRRCKSDSVCGSEEMCCWDKCIGDFTCQDANFISTKPPVPMQKPKVEPQPGTGLDTRPHRPTDRSGGRTSARGPQVHGRPASRPSPETIPISRHHPQSIVSDRPKYDRYSLYFPLLDSRPSTGLKRRQFLRNDKPRGHASLGRSQLQGRPASRPSSESRPISRLQPISIPRNRSKSDRHSLYFPQVAPRLGTSLNTRPFRPNDQPQGQTSVRRLQLEGRSGGRPGPETRPINRPHPQIRPGNRLMGVRPVARPLPGIRPHEDQPMFSGRCSTTECTLSHLILCSIEQKPDLDSLRTFTLCVAGNMDGTKDRRMLLQGTKQCAHIQQYDWGRLTRCSLDRQQSKNGNVVTGDSPGVDVIITSNGDERNTVSNNVLVNGVPVVDDYTGSTMSKTMMGELCVQMTSNPIVAKLCHFMK
ncbi:unnamed protein product, partial [Meganyctiphanes norvegica]